MGNKHERATVKFEINKNNMKGQMHERTKVKEKQVGIIRLSKYFENIMLSYIY